MITNLSTCPMLLTPLLLGWLLDLILGDPAWLPHPVVGFGKMISFGEKRLNRGAHRRFKGAFLALFLIALVFVATHALFAIINATAFLSPLSSNCISLSSLLPPLYSIDILLPRRHYTHSRSATSISRPRSLFGRRQDTGGTHRRSRHS